MCKRYFSITFLLLIFAGVHAAPWYSSVGQAFIGAFHDMRGAVCASQYYSQAVMREMFPCWPTLYVQHPDGRVVMHELYADFSHEITDPSSIAQPLLSPEQFASVVAREREVSSLCAKARSLGLRSFAQWITAKDAPDTKRATIAGRTLALSTIVGGTLAAGYLLKRLVSRKKDK